MPEPVGGPDRYAGVSRWLAQLSPLGPPRPALSGFREADVCIVGGGFTGLWTAYELRRADPSLEVVVLEAEVAGFGASGRNGGWVLGDLAGSKEVWATRRGRDAVVAQDRAIADTVAEIGAVIAREGIDCDFVHGGTLLVAQTPLELDGVRAAIEADRAWGMGPQDSVLLSAGEAAARVAIDGILGARFFVHCARVQPAALARGLADAAERAGAVIHEHTPVAEIRPGVAVTPGGTVRARYIVRATEGYTAKLPGLRRLLVPLGSSMIATEPLSASTWQSIGWENRETVHAGQHRYVYLQRTADDRIAIGGRGVPYRFGSVTDQSSTPPERTISALRARLAGLFPALDGIGIEQAWHGVLGVSRQWLPAVGLDRDTGIAWAGGYVGEGVAAANLAGRTLRDLLLGQDTELTRLPWVGPIGRSWEPEPLRWIGIHTVNSLLVGADRREARTNRRSLETKLARFISGQDL